MHTLIRHTRRMSKSWSKSKFTSIAASLADEMVAPRHVYCAHKYQEMRRHRIQPPRAQWMKVG